MSKKVQKVPVAQQAVIMRLNRKLAKEGQVLRKRRGRFTGNLGDYYLVDVQRNIIADTDVEVENLARKMGVLEPFEAIAE